MIVHVHTEMIITGSHSYMVVSVFTLFMLSSLMSSTRMSIYKVLTDNIVV